MTKGEIEALREQLLRLGRRLKGAVADLENEAFRKAGGEASGNLSNVPVHPADLGTDNFEQEVNMSLLENEEQTLEEIAAALDRIGQGSYGRCEECGRDIPGERLRAVPYTRYCVDCARQQQAGGPGR